MTFSPWHYAIPGIILPLLVMILVLVTLFLWYRRLIFRRQKVRAWILALSMFLFIFVYLFSVFFNSIPAMSMVLETNVPVQQTVGTITAVREGPVFPQYYDASTDTLSPATWITIDDIDYYLPGDGFAVGDRVELVWVTEEHAIKSIKLQPDPHIPDGTLTISTPVPEPPKDPAVENTYRTVGQVFLWIVILRFALPYLFGQKLADWLHQEDKRHRNGIVPSGFGKLHFCVTFVPFMLMVLFFVMAEFGAALLVLAIVGGFFLWILYQRQHTGLTVFGHNLILKERRKTTEFELSDIQSVTWLTKPGSGIRVLRIRFYTGYALEYEQEYYWGLQDTYNRIQRKRNKF